MIEDRRGEAGWTKSLTNAGRAAGHLVGMGRQAMPVGNGDGPLPLPNEASMQKWQTLEDMYANDDIYGFGETDEPSNLTALKQTYDPASLGSGQLRTVPRM